MDIYKFLWTNCAIVTDALKSVNGKVEKLADAAAPQSGTNDEEEGYQTAM
jgi:hypothetical protein